MVKNTNLNIKYSYNLNGLKIIDLKSNCQRRYEQLVLCSTFICTLVKKSKKIAPKPLYNFPTTFLKTCIFHKIHFCRARGKMRSWIKKWCALAESRDLGKIWEEWAVKKCQKLMVFWGSKIRVSRKMRSWFFCILKKRVLNPDFFSKSTFKLGWGGNCSLFTPLCLK